MSRWYYTYHIHIGSVSVFETAEYGGRGGYASKEDAVSAARSMLVRDQQKLSVDAATKAIELSRLVSKISELTQTILTLENEYSR